MGRFIIWTKSAFEKLDGVFGTKAQASSSKKGWKPPAHIMTQPDLSRLINSDEIQSVVNAPKTGKTRAHAPLKRNPLKNKAAMDRLNPYAKVAAEMRQRAEAERAKAKAGKKAGANPWGEGATTLEWTLSSPPPYHQFSELPVIEDHHTSDDHISKAHPA